MMMLERISHLLLLVLVLSQLPQASHAGRSPQVWGGPLLTIDPMGALIRRLPRRRPQPKERSYGYHDILLCNSDVDELTEMRSLGLSSRPEKEFFTAADSALMRRSNSQSNDDGDYSNVVECSSTAAILTPRPLLFWETMVCGAISRSIAQTVMHPANTMKTILQSSRVPPSIASLLQPKNFRRLTVGAGANFILSVPHGAVNFAVLELVRTKMNELVAATGIEPEKIGPGLDFLSSAVSTICCSIVSTPQMMITDNIMAGNYPNLPKAIQGLYSSQGIAGFYAGWFPGLAGKIPSYALTWTLFQELKNAHRRAVERAPTDIENSIMGCISSATTVCIMIPVDTIKTRLVTQASMAVGTPYKGIIDCAVRVYREEGIKTFYRGLPPRLVSVVPMIGIQFGVYEFMKKVMVERSISAQRKKELLTEPMFSPHEASETTFQETAMEVAADNVQPFPAPQFHQSHTAGEKKKLRKKR